MHFLTSVVQLAYILLSYILKTEDVLSDQFVALYR